MGRGFVKLRSMNLNSLLLAIASLCLLNACSLKEESKSYSYDFNVNGCPTKQSFSDHGSYCQGLKNEALNNGCARELREKTFEANCAPPTAAFQPTNADTTALPERKSSKPLQMPLDPFDIPKGLKNRNDEEKDLKLRKTELFNVTGKSFDVISLASTNAGESLVSTLKGEFQVVAIDPVTNRDALQFESASRVRITSASLEKCDVTLLNFKTTGDKVAFEIVGKELASNLLPTSCLIGFGQMIRDGFTVEFQNVRAEGAALETVIPTVILRVETAGER